MRSRPFTNAPVSAPSEDKPDEAVQFNDALVDRIAKRTVELLLEMLVQRFQGLVPRVSNPAQLKKAVRPVRPTVNITAEDFERMRAFERRHGRG